MRIEGDPHICYTRAKFSTAVSRGVLLVSRYHGMHMWKCYVFKIQLCYQRMGRFV